MDNSSTTRPHGRCGPGSLREDEREVLEHLYREFGPQIRRFLRSRTGSSAVADDLTSMVFEAAAQQILEGRHDDVTPAWLTTVAQRRVVDRWRQLERERIRNDKIRVQVSTTPAAALGAAPDDLGVHDALSRLSECHRRALVARYVSGCSVAEVASELGLSYAAAQSALARARHCLKVLLRSQPNASKGPRAAVPA